MKKAAALALTFLLLLAGPLCAQPVTPAATAYTGPRFPGGPDSLRALVTRSLRLAPPGLTGLVVMQMELKEGSRPVKFELLVPPAPVNPALMAAGKRAVALLKTQMPDWQPGLADPASKPNDKQKVTLSLHFGLGPPAKSYAYAYADSEPVFPNLAPLLSSKDENFYNQRVTEATVTGIYKTPSRKIALFTQISVRYPREAMQTGQQGRVMLYFEVSETGAIENTQIVGTAGALLDAEVLRVAQKLPAAVSPALLRGQPVRVFYTMPVGFKIQ